MKLTCEKSYLISAAQTASRATAAKSAVPALEGLLLEANETELKVTGYNLKIGISTSMPADVIETGDIVLNSRLFCDIVRRLPDDEVTIEVDESLNAVIFSGNSHFNIMGMSAQDYPELPSVDYQNAITVQQKVLRSMISQTIFAVSSNEARPIHTGSLFEIENNMLTVVSVDGYRLAMRREPVISSETENCSFVVPGVALVEVERIAADTENELKITQGSKNIVFTIGNTRLISRRLEGEFLNYKNSIPKNNRYAIGISRTDLINSVERVSLIISDQLKSPVRCTFNDGELDLITNTALGKATDKCPIKGDGDRLEIGFNNRYLLDALKAAPADELCLQLSTGISPCIIVPAGEEANFLYMILPVRLKAGEN